MRAAITVAVLAATFFVLSSKPAYSQGSDTPRDKSVQSAAEAGGSAAVVSQPDAFKYMISYVESQRKWKFGLRSEPYNKISQYLEDLLVKRFAGNGFGRVDSLSNSCRKVIVELLEVSTHPAMFHKPGMDVAATISVVDAGGHQVYSRGFRGESRTVMNTYGHLINHAVEDLVENVGRDGDLIKAIGGAPADPPVR